MKITFFHAFIIPKYPIICYNFPESVFRSLENLNATRRKTHEKVKLVVDRKKMVDHRPVGYSDSRHTCVTRRPGTNVFKFGVNVPGDDQPHGCADDYVGQAVNSGSPGHPSAETENEGFLGPSFLADTRRCCPGRYRFRQAGAISGHRLADRHLQASRPARKRITHQIPPGISAKKALWLATAATTKTLFLTDIFSLGVVLPQKFLEIL
jgi:hypothetical protein